MVLGLPMLNETPERKAQDDEARLKIACLNNGGTWDAKSKTCIPKKVEEKEETKKQPPATNDPVLKLAREKGLSLENAADVLLSKTGGTPQQQLARASANATNVQEANTEAQQLFQQQNPISLGGETLPTLGQQNTFENVATGASAVAGGVAGAKIGAIIGTALAPGVGTAVGGVVGAIGGAIGGAYAKVTIQKRQQIKEANKIFTQSKKNKNEILNMINAGLINEGQARSLWEEEKSNIALSHSYLKTQTQSDLNNFLGNPGDDLIAVERYLQLDQFYDLEFEKSLLAPNPSKILFIPPTQEEQ